MDGFINSGRQLSHEALAIFAVIKPSLVNWPAAGEAILNLLDGLDCEYLWTMKYTILTPRDRARIYCLWLLPEPGADRVVER